MTTRMLCFVLAALGGLASTAGAAPYWIAYEGYRFPEEDGWWHIWGDEPGHRSIDDGVFVLDTLHDIHMVDYYVMNMWGELDPDPGEVFVLEWRLFVDAATGGDVGVSVYADDRWGLALRFDDERITSVFEHGVEAAFTPGVFHEYRLTSDDMRTYQLYVDDTPVLEGSFWLSLTESRASFGDCVQGFASRSCWDYFRFGVVPEPATWVMIVPAVCIVLRRRPR